MNYFILFSRVFSAVTVTTKQGVLRFSLSNVQLYKQQERPLNRLHHRQPISKWNFETARYLRSSKLRQTWSTK